MENFITLQNFVKIPNENIKLKIGNVNSSFLHTTTYEVVLTVKVDYEYTYKVNKRYTEFQGLYDSLTYRYHNLSFPEFPSKTQVFHKEETRKKYFETFLTDILILSSVHKEIRKELLSIIYEFIFKSDTKKNKFDLPANNSMSLVISEDKSANTKKTGSFDLTLERSNLSQLNLQTDPILISNSSKKLDEISEAKPIDVTELSEKMHKDGWFIEYTNKSLNQSTYKTGYLKFGDNCLKIFESILTNNFQLILPLYGAAYDLLSINKKMEIKTIDLIDLKEAYEQLKKLVSSKKINEKDFIIRQILSEVNIRVYHPYDKEDFYIRISPDNYKLRDLMKIINILENLIKQKGANTRFIKKIDETNSFIYGKINLEIRSVEIEGLQPGMNTYVVISLPPYEFKTKTSMVVEHPKSISSLAISKSDRMSLSFDDSIGGNNENKRDSVNSFAKCSNTQTETIIINPSLKANFHSNNANNISNKAEMGNSNNSSNNNLNNNNINNESFSRFEFYQTFVFPIHNKFEKLKIEVFTKNLQGIFAKREIIEKICEHEILIPDIMNSICFGEKKMQINLENNNKNVKAGKSIINIKINNCTSILSNFAKNKNKNVLEDMSVEKSDEDLSIKKLFKRLKKILILIKDFKEYYKTLFRFKYPNFSFIVMICSIAYFLFFDIKYFLVHVLFFMFIIAFLQSHYYKKYLSCYFNSYIFSRKNDLDFSDDNTTAMTKIELEDSEVKKESYLTDKGEKPNLIKIIIEPMKTYKNIRDSYHKVLIKFTRYVSNVEKIKNLFLFTDPILSIYFMTGLIFVILLVYSIEFKYLMLFVVVKKFLAGYSYYKNKHINNLEIANILLKYCHQENKSKQKSFINSESHMKSTINAIITTNIDKASNLLNLSTINSPSNLNNTVMNFLSGNLNNNNKNINNSENRDAVEFEDIEEKIRQIKNSENMIISHDIDNVSIFDDKFKIFIKEQLEKHIDVVISMEFLNSISKMGEIKEVIGKCKGVLKIKKDSILFNKTINNQKIYKESLDADQIFIYFIQNVKSDFYLSKYYSFEEE